MTTRPFTPHNAATKTLKMKKNLLLLSVISFSLLLASCQKEVQDTDLPPVTTSSDILGNWTLVSMNVKTEAINEVTAGSDVQKTVTTSDYTTENNAGTVNITATTFNSINFSYSVNTTAKAALYENNVLIDTFLLPVQASVPATSGSAAYTRVNADSIYFQSGSIFAAEAAQRTLPAGASIRLDQDKMYMTQHAEQETTETVQGETVRSIVRALVVVTLKR